MANIAKQLQEIENRLNVLRQYQQGMVTEIARLEQRLQELKNHVNVQASTPEQKITTDAVIAAAQYKAPPLPPHRTPQKGKQQSSLETFIGTNLISKIGILITIIGVFVGARYAIDRDLISPVTRIISSYAFAGVLALVGLRLKKKYNAFSAVLIGGSIAIIYFSTYVGFDLYHLFPIAVAFVIMFITTLLAVALALWYDQKVIALIGQVAAYAIPILLSTGSGKVAVLFSYISIINAGLMILSFRKNWKVIYRIAFSITWTMFSIWVSFGDKQLAWGWALFFISVCFVTFYTTYLSYKIFRKELYNIVEVAVLLLNAIIFYVLGYVIIDREFSGTNVLTMFTIANAVVHFVAGYFIHRLKLADDSVRMFLFGQALTFITIAIPVKLDGSWVTLLWSIETAILIYVAARSKRILYFQLCGAIMIVTLFSLAQDWVQTYKYERLETSAFFNQTFLTSLMTAGAFLYASIICRRSELPFSDDSRLRTIFRSWVPVAFLIVLYLGIFHDVGLYFDKINNGNYLVVATHWLSVSMLHFYTLLFVAAAALINHRYVRSEQMYFLLLIASVVAVFFQLTLGSYALSNLRDTPYGWVRYLNVAALAALFYVQWIAMRHFAPEKSVRILFSLIFNASLLTIISNEYIHWVKSSGSSNEYKLGLSIIFAGYALVMLFRGLLKEKGHLRIAAIVLFGLAIIKLFAYDLRAMSTIGKTIVLIVLGVILLAASFLYNRFLRKETPNP